MEILTKKMMQMMKGKLQQLKMLPSASEAVKVKKKSNLKTKPSAKKKPCLKTKPSHLKKCAKKQMQANRKAIRNAKKKVKKALKEKTGAKAEKWSILKKQM